MTLSRVGIPHTEYQYTTINLYIDPVAPRRQLVRRTPIANAGKRDRAFERAARKIKRAFADFDGADEVIIRSSPLDPRMRSPQGRIQPSDQLAPTTPMAAAVSVLRGPGFPFNRSRP